MDRYTIKTHCNGVFVTILNETTGKDVFLQGDDATVFINEYNELYHDHHNVPNSRAARISWLELMDTLCGVYFN